jgi:hypothetical protein
MITSLTDEYALKVQSLRDSVIIDDDVADALDASSIREALIDALATRIDRKSKYGDGILNWEDDRFRFIIELKYDRIMRDIKDVNVKADNVLDLAVYSLLYYQSILNKEKK